MKQAPMLKDMGAFAVLLDRNGNHSSATYENVVNFRQDQGRFCVECLVIYALGAVGQQFNLTAIVFFGGL